MRETLIDAGASVAAEVVGYTTGLVMEKALAADNYREAVNAARECRQQLEAAGVDVEAEAEGGSLADVLELAAKKR